MKKDAGKESSKESYGWYKSHGICPMCKKEKAASGKVHCPNCLDYMRLYRAEKYEGLTENEKREAMRQNAANRRARHARGVCVDCGGKADGKSWRCKKCNAKNAARVRERRAWDDE